MSVFYVFKGNRKETNDYRFFILSKLHFPGRFDPFSENNLKFPLTFQSEISVSDSKMKIFYFTGIFLHSFGLFIHEVLLNLNPILNLAITWWCMSCQVLYLLLKLFLNYRKFCRSVDNIHKIMSCFQKEPLFYKWIFSWLLVEVFQNVQSSLKCANKTCFLFPYKI